MRDADKKYRKSGQSVLEYVVLMGIFLAAVLSTNFIGRIQDSLKGYFAGASKAIVETKTLSGEHVRVDLPTGAPEATEAR